MKKTVGRCAVEYCEVLPKIRQMCPRHYKMWLKHGRTYNINAKKGTGWICDDGYRHICHNYKISHEHVLIAEKALGKPLPPGAVVHHFNENRSDNRPENLVICPSQEYHFLLHKQAKEFGIIFEGQKATVSIEELGI